MPWVTITNVRGPQGPKGDPGVPYLGNIPSGADFNTLLGEGAGSESFYWVNPSSINGPGGVFSGWVRMIKSANNRAGIQTAVRSDGTGIFQRTYLYGSNNVVSWGPWRRIDFDEAESILRFLGIDRRLDMIEEIATEPGTRLENLIIDPNPATTVDTWVGGNVTLQQATDQWGRAIATGGSGTSVVARGGFGSGITSKAELTPGQPVAGRVTIRAMAGQRMSATMNIRAFTWDGSAFVNGTTIATSGQLHIDPDAINAVTFEAVADVPANTPFTHVELWFTFRRFGETYPSAGDFVYFRQAALYSGPNAKSPVQYIDGNSANSFWLGKPNASPSLRLVPRASGGSTGAASKAAHQVLLDDFTYRRGGPKMIGQVTSLSFRVDHGLKNFNSKMRQKLESYGFKYALTLGSRDWGNSENSGVTPAMVNDWVVGGFAEIWSHGPSHDDADTTAKVRDFIVNSRKELETALPAAVVDGFMPPGAGGTRYMGFGPSDTPQKYFDTLAGQLILETYAVGTGQFPGTAYRLQDGQVRVGQAYFNMDEQTPTGIMSRVQTAISRGMGIQLMIHPSLVDTPGHITTAQLHDVIDQIKALQDSGKVLVMSAYDQTLADSTTTPGAPGPPGAGVPTGGTALQVIRKNSDGTTTEWVTPTKSMVGLNQVDNTSDLQKPVSLAMAQELDTKQNRLVKDSEGFYIIGG